MVKGGNSLAVQWLGLCTFTAEGPGSISGWRTKIPQAVQQPPKKEKLSKDLNRRFCKEDIQIANNNMKRWLTFLVIREIQIQSTMRYYFTPFRVVTVKKTITTVDEYVEKQKLIHC